MKRAWILAFALACLPAAAQFGNLLKSLDPNKIIDTGKKLAEANKDFTQDEEIQLGTGITAGVLGGAPPIRDANVQRYVNRVSIPSARTCRGPSPSSRARPSTRSPCPAGMW